MKNVKSIPVLEIFGPTVQGEGMIIGQKTMFVRTAGCDYACAWCDSAFTWDGSAKDDIRWMEAEEIYQELKGLGGDRLAHVTLSGGNPALFPQLEELIKLLHDHKIEVALETQGSRWQNWFFSVDQLTLSPKPPSSGMNTDWNMLDRIVNQLLKHHSIFCLKIVVFNEDDLVYAQRVHQRYPQVQLYLQSGNSYVSETDPKDLLQHLLSQYKWLVKRVMNTPELWQVKVLPQLHSWIWGNQRGV